MAKVYTMFVQNRYERNGKERKSLSLHGVYTDRIAALREYNRVMKENAIRMIKSSREIYQMIESSDNNVSRRIKECVIINDIHEIKIFVVETNSNPFRDNDAMRCIDR